MADATTAAHETPIPDAAAAVADIATKGFHVVRNLVPSEILATFEATFERRIAREDGSGALGSVVLCAPHDMAPIHAMLEGMQTQLADASGGDFAPNHIAGGRFFGTKNQDVFFQWHQDHESYFQYQTHANYLNLYIPVRKPDATKSGLCVARWDKFSGRFPELADMYKSKGGSHVNTDAESRTTSIFDDAGDHAAPDAYKAEDGSAKLEDFLFDDIMECPDLLPGDAILMRGDCFHRTQDHATDRVALSIRINRLDSKLTKAIHELDTESRRTWRREAPLFPSMMDYAFTLQEEWTWEGILKKKAELGL